MSISCDKIFLLVSRYLSLWPWPSLEFAIIGDICVSQTPLFWYNINVLLHLCCYFKITLFKTVELYTNVIKRYLHCWFIREGRWRMRISIYIVAWLFIDVKENFSQFNDIVYNTFKMYIRLFHILIKDRIE